MIYLDNAATTKVSKSAKNAMQPYLDSYYGNPSSSYDFGRISADVMESGRETISRTLNCDKDEIYYTCGGTEGDNFAIKQVCEKYKQKGKHIITTKIEHHAVLNSCRAMEREGFEVTYLNVDRWGRIKISEMERAIRKDTILISVMHANNEIGTIEPIALIGQIAKKNNIIFHTDAVQSYGHLPIDVRYFNVDILSASSHKFHGPKGVGFMFLKKGLELNPFMDGGSQEKGMRAGTGNVSGVAGMSQAAKDSYLSIRENMRRVKQMRNYTLNRLLREIPGVHLNGHPEYRLPNNINISIDNVDGTLLMNMLDEKEICVSTGSACTQGNSNPSHVLKAIGLTDEMAQNSIRITLSEENTFDEMDCAVDVIKEQVLNLRKKL